MKRDDAGRIVEFAAASESIALEAIGIERERDVAAGEALFIDMEMNLHSRIDSLAQTCSPCIFEYVYLARPDSVMDNISVYEARVQMGIRLAERVRTLRVLQNGGNLAVLEPGDAGYAANLPPLEHMIDCVMAVPDTSRHTAISVGFRGDFEAGGDEFGEAVHRGAVEEPVHRPHVHHARAADAAEEHPHQAQPHPCRFQKKPRFLIGRGERTVGAGGGRFDRARQHDDDVSGRDSPRRSEPCVRSVGGAADSVLQRVWNRYADATRIDRLSEDRKGGGRGDRGRFRALSELGGLEAGVSRCGVVWDRGDEAVMA